jgi:hypothetical protein
LEAVIKEVEGLAKTLRADIRKRIEAVHLPKALIRAAERLRKRAAYAAGQVEKYAHQLRQDLERQVSAKPRKAAPKRRKRAKKSAPQPVVSM